MKISNSKKELARIISENSGWRNGEFAAQDGDGGVGGYAVKPEWNSRSKYWWCAALGQWFLANKIKNHHQTVLSRAEYFHLYPMPDDDGWIELDGKHEPAVATSGLTLWCKWSDGLEQSHEANMVDWFDDSDVRIIAYRLHKPEQSKPEFCESVMRSIPGIGINSKNIDINQVDDINVVESKPTIEQLAADYRNAKDYAERKQEEADAAKADADAKLKALELAGESLGLLVSPIADKQGPELVSEVNVGDEVECVESNIKRDKYNGTVGRLHFIDEGDTSTPYLVDFGGAEKIWCHEVKFIRRP